MPTAHTPVSLPRVCVASNREWEGGGVAEEGGRREGQKGGRAAEGRAERRKGKRVGVGRKDERI